VSSLCILTGSRQGLRIKTRFELPLSLSGACAFRLRRILGLFISLPEPIAKNSEDPGNATVSSKLGLFLDRGKGTTHRRVSIGGSVAQERGATLTSRALDYKLAFLLHSALRHSSLQASSILSFFLPAANRPARWHQSHLSGRHSRNSHSQSRGSETETDCDQR
jgi:hypothetical protein